MSLIKVEDIAFVRFRAPDLSEMAGFLEDFGLRPERQGQVLYARGSGPAPFLHVTVPGDAGFAFHELTMLSFRVAGPAAWKDKILAADWAALAALPWITPSLSSAYSSMLAQLFGEKDLELNSVIRFQNASLGRTALEAGAGMMLLREDYALQGEREGNLCVSPIARARFCMSVVHLSSRSKDPLISAFVDAAGRVWPKMKRAKV